MNPTEAFTILRDLERESVPVDDRMLDLDAANEAAESFYGSRQFGEPR